ncbi:MAG: hypothetical protein LUD72_11470 [Bacteroidales bacterium]|nr:hypothetical protein [Bacteroidales bacterium]
MRYDTPVYFQTITAGEYDAETGNYGEDVVEETKKWANRTDSKTDALTIQYADIKEGNIIIRLQNHYSAPFDRVRIGTRVYKPVSVRGLRSKDTFVLAEVQ